MTKACAGLSAIVRPEANLALVRRLTEAAPDWTVQKGIESALVAYGDIDSIAPGRIWPQIIEEFRRWAFDYSLGPVVVCDHVPYVLHLVALDPSRPEFFELDVNRRKVFLGSTLFTPEDIKPLVCRDERGFRRLRTGAEAMLKFIQNGARRGGHPDYEGLRKKRVLELLQADFEGFRQSATLFGPAANALITAAEAACNGGWNRAAMLKVEAWCLFRSLREPWNLAARVGYRIARKRCPLLQLLSTGRRVPPDREAWLQQVKRNHVVLTRPDAQL